MLYTFVYFPQSISKQIKRKKFKEWTIDFKNIDNYFEEKLYNKQLNSVFTLVSKSKTKYLARPENGMKISIKEKDIDNGLWIYRVCDN